MADRNKFVTRDYLLDQFEGYDRSIASQKYATSSAVNNLSNSNEQVPFNADA